MHHFCCETSFPPHRWVFVALINFSPRLLRHTGRLFISGERLVRTHALSPFTFKNHIYWLSVKTYLTVDDCPFSGVRWFSLRTAARRCSFWVLMLGDRFYVRNRSIKCTTINLRSAHTHHLAGIFISFCRTPRGSFLHANTTGHGEHLSCQQRPISASTLSVLCCHLFQTCMQNIRMEHGEAGDVQLDGLFTLHTHRTLTTLVEQTFCTPTYTSGIGFKGMLCPPRRSGHDILCLRRAMVAAMNTSVQKGFRTGVGIGTLNFPTPAVAVTTSNMFYFVL